MHYTLRSMRVSYMPPHDTILSSFRIPQEMHFPPEPVLHQPPNQRGLLKPNQRDLTNVCLHFCVAAVQEMHSALNRLERAGCNGYVLDLRDNPGGLVQAGLDVARLWMDGAPDVFLVSGRDDEPVQRVS
jgi:hypothetical protein